MVDVTISHPSNHFIVGPSMVGKSTLMASLVKNKTIMFDPVPKHVLWYCQDRSTIPAMLLEQDLLSQCFEGYDGYDNLRSRVMINKDQGGSLVLFDDFLVSKELKNDIDKIFYFLAHSSNTSFVIASQELYHENKHYRTASKNSHNLWLFKNPRSANEIMSLSKQISPFSPSWIIKSFEDITSEPHSYAYFSFHQKSADVCRMMADYLPSDRPIRVFMKNKTL